MIHDLKPYPEYKDSAVPWLREVPEHWDVLPNRALFAEVKEREHPEEQMLSVTITKGVIRQQALLADSSKKDSSNQDKSAYKLVRPGDIAYNKMRAWQGAIGVSDYCGIVSPAYVVQRPREGADARYFHYLLRTPAFAKEAERWSYGITSDMWSLRPEHFKMIYGCLPPLAEQTGIVRFLDHADRRIRRYIRAKRRLIELLNEQKQAIIHRAVTRGLDPSVRLKPSGVAWLGEVPEHWGVVPLRRVTIARCDEPFGAGLKSQHYTDTGIRVIRLQNIGHGEFKDKDAAFIAPRHYATLGDHSVLEGDLVLAGLGDDRHPAGRACVAPAELGPAMVKADCFRFRVDRNRLHPRFGALQLTATSSTVSSILSTGATRQRINLQTMSTRAVVLPSLDEQSAIVAFLDAQTDKIDAAVAADRRALDLLKEFRTRLIADIVPGKLDVREAAVKLPDEREEAQAFEDAETVAESDEATEAMDFAESTEEPEA